MTTQNGGDGTVLNLVPFLKGEGRNQPQRPANPPKPPAPPGHITPYANAAVENECAALASMPPKSGRNDALNKAAFNLGSLILAGEVEEQYVRDKLLEACNHNGVLAEDGQRKCEQTIDSGLRGANVKVGAREVKPLEDTIKPAAVLDLGPKQADSVDSDEPKQPRTEEEWLAHILDAEQDFWQSRPSLQLIYDAAMARMVSPWGVLAHCAARALMNVRPCGYLPPLIGGAGSLNSFFCLVATSGGGKSAVSEVGRAVMFGKGCEERQLGSGEGLLEAFIRPADKETGEPEGRYEALLFTADESDTIGALKGQSGSTLLPTLRTAWAGGTISFGYRGRTTQRIEGHSYRMCLIMSVQPERAGWLFDDAAGGTPQRFMWFPSTDPRISLDKQKDGALPQISLPSWREWEFNFEIPIPDEARELILTERVKAARGQRDALDGHALFCREKFAYALTVLDGRTDMSSEDWRLSGIAAEVSARTRSWAQWGVQHGLAKQAAEKGRLMGVTYAESDAAKAAHASERLSAVSRRVLELLESGPKSQRELTRGVSVKGRPYLSGASLKFMVSTVT